MPATTAPAAYTLNDRKYCPTCGGKAQDPQMSDPAYSLGVLDFAPDGTPIWEEGYGPERCDEPYHDTTDPEYRED